MKNKNKYGFYSGGYIFDRIDRYALRTLNNAYPETKDELWFTSHCKIDYKKQLCDNDESTYMRTIVFQKLSESAVIGVEFVQGKTLIATCYVDFTKAKGDYCKLKYKKKKK
jgi:hypothetical protein